jgi:hypothetical protein
LPARFFITNKFSSEGRANAALLDSWRYDAMELGLTLAPVSGRLSWRPLSFQNLVLKGHVVGIVFRGIVFRNPGLCGVGIREDLEVLGGSRLRPAIQVRSAPACAAS